MQLANDVAEIEVFRVEHLAAAERQQLPCERAGTFRRVDDFGRARPPVLVVQLANELLGVSADDKRNVVEVVGDPARQLTHHLHLLGVMKLGGELLPLGDVGGQHDLRSFAGERGRVRRNLDVDDRPVTPTVSPWPGPGGALGHA